MIEYTERGIQGGDQEHPAHPIWNMKDLESKEIPFVEVSPIDGAYQEKSIPVSADLDYSELATLEIEKDIANQTYVMAFNMKAVYCEHNIDYEMFETADEDVMKQAISDSIMTDLEEIVSKALNKTFDKNKG